MASERLTTDAVWERICSQAGEFFKTHRNQLFTYRIEGDLLLPSHTDLRIPRRDFELVLPMLPLADSRKIAKYVTGWVHVAAVINDARIAQGDW